ncbi:MAG TPA: BrnA antitoxin family protein [Acidobacteriaceae bacterium]|nr:BrnA antitoxin family protein [Acidobacteriaceae bacterium]
MKAIPIEGRPGMMSFRLEPGTPLTDEERAELEALKNRPDSEIDTSDIPEWTDEMFKRAVRGRDVMKYWRPVKQAVSLRLDADVLAWLKKDGQGYQTRANQMLRERMMKDLEG